LVERGATVVRADVAHDHLRGAHDIEGNGDRSGQHVIGEDRGIALEAAPGWRADCFHHHPDPRSPDSILPLTSDVFQKMIHGVDKSGHMAFSENMTR
jgi:hypothetical protein